MNRFIKLTFSFIGVLVVLIILFEWVTSYVILKNTDFTLPTGTKYLVLGHSQPEHAFNDSLIDGLKNLAEGGESYFYTYYKSKEIIKSNVELETVFIIFSNNTIETKRDAWTWDSYYMASRLDRFAPLIDFQGKMKLACNNYSCFFETMNFELKERWVKLKSGELEFNEKLGGYKITEKRIDIPFKEMTMEDKRIQEINDFELSKSMLSTHALFYLNKLISLCHTEGKQVVLIRLPQQKDYNFWGNEKLFQEVKKNYFNELPFLDFSKLDMNEDDFIDASHLSYSGATRFSIYFDNFIKSEKRFDFNHESLSK